MFEVGRTLTGKSFHSLLLVCGREHRMEGPPLEQQSLGQTGFVGAIDALLDHHHRRQRITGDGLGRLDRLLDQVGDRYDPADQPGPLGFLDIHHPPGQTHFHGFGLADQPGQPLGAASARQDAQFDFRLPELGGIGGEDGWQSFTFPTSSNPYIPTAEIESARKELPEIIFRQEYLAEFVDSDGAVFRRVQEAAVLDPLEGPLPRHQYSAGVDVASSVDYTVVTILDMQSKDMVFMDRFNRVDYPVLIDRLAAIYERWKLSGMVIEANSIGQPVIDHMLRRGIGVTPFTTTNTSKQMIIQALQSAFENSSIKILNVPVLIGELLSFESKRTISGSFSYSAPDGMHDDSVMSLALALYGCSGANWLVS